MMALHAIVVANLVMTVFALLGMAMKLKCPRWPFFAALWAAIFSIYLQLGV